MLKPEITGIPVGLRRLLTSESDSATLMAVAKFLKASRNYIVLAWYTEQLLRRAHDLRFWQLHAQALVELGLLAAASEVLDGIRSKVRSAENAPIFVDLIALEGRIAKQRFVEASEKTRKKAYLAAALKSYRAALDCAGTDHGLRYFPGINLVGLLSAGERVGITTPIGFSLAESAASVKDDLDATKMTENQNHWWQATQAECALARGDYHAFAEAVTLLVESKKSEADIESEVEALERIRVTGYFDALPDIDPFSADAFVLASFHRQLFEIWSVDRIADPEVARSVMGIRQALLKRRGGSLEFDATTLSIIGQYKDQAVFGEAGPMPFNWVLQGIERAKAVAAIMVPSTYGTWRRIGTGFLVALDGDNKDHYLLTNHHVVPDLKTGARYRARFEALDPVATIEIDRLVWQSEAHDAALLVLKVVPPKAKALNLRTTLPPLETSGKPQRVYVIGHTGGEELHMSLQDNELLDHEEGMPKSSDVAPVRLHYRAPTRDGNSGSPVFAEDGWELIALHRGSITLDGGLTTTLSGFQRYNRANEGISMASIGAALSAATRLKFQ